MQSSPSTPLLHPKRFFVALVIVIFALLVAVQPSSAATSVVDVAAAPGGQWVLNSNGSVTAIAGAKHYGDRDGSLSDARAIIPHPGGKGYWIADSRGTVSAHGSAEFRGDLASLALNLPIVGGTATPSGKGYWLVAADGGIFAFGDAKFWGSTGAMTLNAPVVGMASTPSGRGYWLVASDGGIFSFGDAKFWGSAGSLPLVRPIVGIRAAADGKGYLLVSSDGGIFAYGNVVFHGSLGGQGIFNITSVAPTANGGYVLLSSTSRLYEFPNGGTQPVTVEQRIVDEIFDSVNKERAARGIPELTWSLSLAESAAIWSQEMSETGFRHSDLNSLGYSIDWVYNSLGENIYWGNGDYADSGSAHVTLMNSSSHRTALLDSAYTDVGIGAYCTSDGRLYVVQQFGRIATAGSGSHSGWRPLDPFASPGDGGVSCGG